MDGQNIGFAFYLMTVITLDSLTSEHKPGLTQYFCKGHDSKYFRLCASDISTQPCCCGVKAATDEMYTNMCSCVPIKRHLQKLLVGGTWPIGSSVLSYLLNP